MTVTFFLSKRKFYFFADATALPLYLVHACMLARGEGAKMGGGGCLYIMQALLSIWGDPYFSIIPAGKI